MEILASKACLDLLNENMVFLSDEAEDVLGEWQSSLSDGRDH